MLEYGNYITPLRVVFFGLYTIFSEFLSNKIGLRKCLILGNFVSVLAYIGFYLEKNIFLFYIFFLIGLFGNGIVFLIPMKNMCIYYEERKGVLASVHVTFGLGVQSLSSFLS